MNKNYEEYKVQTKKDKKITLFIVIIFFLFLFSCLFLLYRLFFFLSKNEEVRLDNNYEQISNYVKNNSDGLKKIVIKQKNGEKFKLPSRVKLVRSCYSDNSIRVEFTTFSVGKDKSVGFFYSEDDKPIPFECWNIELKEYGKNKWIWKDENNNYEKIIKITNNWYYYDLSF